MKNQIKTTIILLTIATIFASCGVPSMGFYEPHRQNKHLRGTPRFGLKDTVKHIDRYANGGFFHKTSIWWMIVDSIKPVGTKHFMYYCHNINGATAEYPMPENSLYKD